MISVTDSKFVGCPQYSMISTAVFKFMDGFLPGWSPRILLGCPVGSQLVVRGNGIHLLLDREDSRRKGGGSEPREKKARNSSCRIILASVRLLTICFHLKAWHPAT